VRLYPFASLAYFLAPSWIGPVRVETLGSETTPLPEERRQLVERETGVLFLPSFALLAALYVLALSGAVPP
jgi:hypothetical protein